MVVADFHILCVAISPTKAHTILIVDANAVLSGAIAFECFQTIARRYAKIFHYGSSVQILPFPASRTLDTHNAANSDSAEQRFRDPVSEGLEHDVSYTDTRDA